MPIKRVLSSLLVLIFVLSLFVFGETALRIEDVNETEITGAENVRVPMQKIRKQSKQMTRDDVTANMLSSK